MSEFEWIYHMHVISNCFYYVFFYFHCLSIKSGARRSQLRHQIVNSKAQECNAEAHDLRSIDIEYGWRANEHSSYPLRYLVVSFFLQFGIWTFWVGNKNNPQFREFDIFNLNQLGLDGSRAFDNLVRLL